MNQGERGPKSPEAPDPRFKKGAIWVNTEVGEANGTWKVEGDTSDGEGVILKNVPHGGMIPMRKDVLTNIPHNDESDQPVQGFEKPRNRWQYRP